MSGAEQVDSFNPLIAVIWLTQIVILYIDYSQDNRVLWSIPVIGSFFIVQLYFVWKTNYDKMVEERRDKQMQALGGPAGVPEIVPGETNLSDFYKKEEQPKPKNKPKSSVYLNTEPQEEE